MPDSQMGSQDMSYDQKPQRMKFKPEPDITVFELATIIARLNVHCSAELFDKLSPNLRRHFEPSAIREVSYTKIPLDNDDL